MADIEKSDDSSEDSTGSAADRRPEKSQKIADDKQATGGETEVHNSTVGEEIAGESGQETEKGEGEIDIVISVTPHYRTPSPDSEGESDDDDDSVSSQESLSWSDGSKADTLELCRLYKSQLNFARTPRARDEFTVLEIRERALAGELLMFEDEYEDHYQRVRERERREVFLVDYSATLLQGKSLFTKRTRIIKRWFHQMEPHETKTIREEETKFLAISLFDRFLGKAHFVDDKLLRLTLLACVTLSSYILEAKKISIYWRLSGTIGSMGFTLKEVVAMEALIQDLLGHRCYLPTLYTFLSFYMMIVDTTEDDVREITTLLGEVLWHPEHLRFWPSTVGAAIMILAADSDESVRRVTLAHTRTRPEVDDLPDCLRSLKACLTEAL